MKSLPKRTLKFLYCGYLRICSAADVLTKPKKATEWWPETGRLGIPLKEGKVVLKQFKSEVH